jgi:uncharacterized protein YdaU (DUF1376 family)
VNYYPFHIGDYLSATRHLSWEEDAAYRRLLDVYYTSEKPLSLELRAVCRLVLATTDSQREAVQTVLEEFFERTDAGWVNRRADAEITAMQEKQQIQRDKANKRWQKQRAELGTASAMPQHNSEHAAASDGNANAMPPTPTPTPTPVNKETPRKRAAPPAKPDDVSEQVWCDWHALRSRKRAPVTETVLAGARGEADKAGMPLEQFLAIWCRRGSQGLEAVWLKPEERGSPASGETSYQRSQRELVEQATGGLVSRKNPGNGSIDEHPPALALGR